MTLGTVGGMVCQLYFILEFTSLCCMKKNSGCFRKWMLETVSSLNVATN